MIASKIKSFRPPEPYKGKGIKEKGQYILRKEGKRNNEIKHFTEKKIQS